MYFEINDRITQLIRKLEFTHVKFANEIGISASRLSNILTKKNRPDTEVLILIADKFRFLNLEWLLLGEGEMNKGEFHGQKAGNERTNEAFMKILNNQTSEILKLTIENGDLHEQINALKNNTDTPA